MLYSFSNICPLAAVLKLMLTNSVFFVCTVTRVSIFQKRSPECKNDSSVTVFLFNRDLFYVPFSFIAYSWGVFLCQFFFFFSAQSNFSVIREWTLHLIVLLDKVTVETGINYPSQRVFWSDLSLCATIEVLLLSFLPSEWHHWQLQPE